MIIKIINIEKINFSNISHAQAIENVIRSFGEKKHIIIANKDFFENVITEKNGVFSRILKQSAEEARRAQMEYSSLLKFVNFNVVLDFNIKGKDYLWNQLHDSETLTVGPDFFVDSASVQDALIVCEDVNDSDFYKVIASYYSKKIKANLLNIKFQAINGGGGSTKRIFDRKVNNLEVTLCILDNDKKHPKYPEGGTCKNFNGEAHLKTGRIIVINAHEIESLIPFDLLENILIEDKASVEKIESLDRFRRICSEDQTAKFFFDHKKGLDIKTAFDLDKKYGSYWLPLINKANSDSFSECVNNNECDCDSPCFTIAGFGDSLLTKSTAYINNNNPKNFSPSLTGHLEELWNYIGKSFFSWSCAPAKKVRL
ncbi:hypothetical protein [Rahnella sikkimica]|uniref:Uncharacterized protein n=1 Tax=Rahnella sikkimica TaxID=1805933 RepID=A0A2L1UQ88_9GAMM|nr:hypothetical protein [Rahnella sikkimica]AVF35092.1 hypothetical protein BV494_09165 [Rahnella sikkimica]